MNGLFSEIFVSALLFGAVTAAIPMLLAGLGEQMSEKAGVLNIGIEGMMIFGAYCGFLGTFHTGSFWVGFLTGGLGGIIAAAIMVLLCVRHGINQIVIGIGLSLGFDGLTALLFHFQFSRTYPRLDAAPKTEIPLLSDIPWLGQALFNHHLSVYVAVGMVIAAAFIYRRTQLGLNLQAAGDKPAALDVTGVDVIRTRTVAVLTTGAMAGFGGAFLANIGAGLFVPHITNGIGYLGIVLAMLARGHPAWVLWGALLFGLSLALITALQVAGINIPTDIVQMIPYLAIMAMLVIFARQSSLPAALGLPYKRGER